MLEYNKQIKLESFDFTVKSPGFLRLPPSFNRYFRVPIRRFYRADSDLKSESVSEFALEFLSQPFLEQKPVVEQKVLPEQKPAVEQKVLSERLFVPPRRVVPKLVPKSKSRTKSKSVWLAEGKPTSISL